jgi:hypothetical protein
MTFKKLLPVLLLTIFSCFAINAQSFSPWETNFTDKVSKKTNVTYLDLVRKIFPDAKLSKIPNSEVEDLVALKSISVRDLFGQHGEKIYEDQKVILRERLLAKNGNENLLWLIISTVGKDSNCGNCSTNLLAVFRVKQDEAEILDVTEIGEGDLTGFGDDGNYDDSSKKIQEKLTLLSKQEAVIIYNIQGTALGTDDYSIVTIDEKGMHLVLSPFNSEHNTQCGGGYAESIRFKLLKNTVNKYHGLEIIVTTFSSYEDEEESAKPEFLKNFHYFYVWKPAEQKYTPSGNHKTIDKKRKAFHRKIKEGCGSE